MQNKFLESIKREFINQIEEIITVTKKEAEKQKLSSIDTLALINNNINDWISSVSIMIHVDDELLTQVAILKKPFVSAAKKEVALEIAKIIENESSDVTSKINDYLNSVKKKGLDLDGSKTEVTSKNQAEIESQAMDSEKQMVLKRNSEEERRRRELEKTKTYLSHFWDEEQRRQRYFMLIG